MPIHAAAPLPSQLAPADECGDATLVHPKNGQELAARVSRAATAALREQGYVAAIDVMVGIGWLSPSHVLEWRTRRLPFLERGIQANLRRISEAMRLLEAWAEQAGLRPSTTAYVARTAARERLQFSESGEPATRKRHERIGALVESAALASARASIEGNAQH